MKRVKRRLRYTGSIMKVYQDTMKIGQKEAKWDYFEVKGGAAVVPVLPTGEIVMVRQYRNALDRFTLELPAGNYDSPTESRRECAKRELEEETGYRAEEMTFLLEIASMPAFCQEKVKIYVATGLKEGIRNLDGEEEIEVVLCKPKDLEEMIASGKLQDAKTVAGLLGYFRKYCPKG